MQMNCSDATDLRTIVCFYCTLPSPLHPRTFWIIILNFISLVPGIDRLAFFPIHLLLDYLRCKLSSLNETCSPGIQQKQINEAPELKWSNDVMCVLGVQKHAL